VTLWHGDSLNVLRTLPDQSVDCCVTSPPYFGLRDYGEPGQYGLEASPAEYVETMRAVFSEVRRVLSDDGTLWLNLGDSYYSGKGNPGPNSADEKQGARRGWTRTLDRCGADWAKPKDLLGIPWRVAFALQDDGWTLRNDVIWHKPNAMPESVADRLSGRHEHLFMLSKSRSYWFDLDAVREPHTMEQRRRTEPYRYQAPGQAAQTSLHTVRDEPGPDGHPLGRNPGDVWSIPTTPFPGAHFAVFPPALAEQCILAGCKPGGAVLDPFHGSGTTGMVATKHGRKYVGIDLSRDYLDLSLRTRLADGTLTFDGGAA
jgi:site-specific DNA-methyltransferase (cytosine-N4-specific)